MNIKVKYVGAPEPIRILGFTLKEWLGIIFWSMVAWISLVTLFLVV